MENWNYFQDEEDGLQKKKVQKHKLIFSMTPGWCLTKIRRAQLQWRHVLKPTPAAPRSPWGRSEHTWSAPQAAHYGLVNPMRYSYKRPCPGSFCFFHQGFAIFICKCAWKADTSLNNKVAVLWGVSGAENFLCFIYFFREAAAAYYVLWRKVLQSLIAGCISLISRRPVA